MSNTIDDPIVAEVAAEQRSRYQEEFGQHLVQARNRMIEAVLRRLEGSTPHPMPGIERALGQVRQLDPDMREAVRTVALDAVDQVVTGMLTIFATGEETRAGSWVANYVIVAQHRRPGCYEVVEQVDINRGEPLLVVWNQYKKWLSRYCPAELRARALPAGNSGDIA